MSKKAIYKDTIKKNTIVEMQNLGVYKVEYNRVIDIYSELLEQYERLTAEYKRDNYKYKSTTAASGDKKSPLVSTLESLRKDILQYSDRLCLNPKANMKEPVGKKRKSKLAEALDEFS